MKNLSFLIALALCLAPVSAQTFPTSNILPQLVPDLSPGTAFAVPVSGATVGSNVLSLNFTMSPVHTWCSDLRCVITNPAGVSVTVLNNGLGGNTDVGGPYTLTDSAGVLFHSAPLSGTAFAPGTYKGDLPINSLINPCTPDGAWVVTFSDWAGGDTGTVSNLSLTFAVPPAPEYFCISQSGPGAPVTLTHQAGASAITYTNAALANTPAAVPSGWWYGLDIPLPLLLDQFTNPNWGTVFIGSLPAFGVSTVSAFLPATFTIQIVGVHFDAATGLKVYNSLPNNYVVQ